MKKTLAMILSMLLVLTMVPAAFAEPIVELDFWTVFTGEDGVNMDQLVAEFNTANPGIKVNHMQMDASDLYTKAPLAVAAGEGVPDVAIVHTERIRDNSMLWAQAGQTVASLKLLEDPAYKEMKQAFLADYGTSMVVSDFINYGLVVDILDPIGWESTYGRITPEEFVTALQQKIDEKIAAK